MNVPEHNGEKGCQERSDPPAGTPAHNLVTGIEYIGPKEPFYVPAPCRVVELMINGEVCAGFPSPAEKEFCDNISFDEYLVEHRRTLSCLRTRGIP
ncbi:MAG: hypothetical protein CVU71_17340 [Deltaproteobacteria bacterium HGW-Deltaproteobacteria-6]|nr:MAG: hypothetical protein CVU71_17340 [Deltaproteobacteria bacterium HGW-Deltaproteobacteria-6]